MVHKQQQESITLCGKLLFSWAPHVTSALVKFRSKFVYPSFHHPLDILSWPGSSAEMCRIFLLYKVWRICLRSSWRIFLGTFSTKLRRESLGAKFGGFCLRSSWRIFLGTFSTKMRREIRRQSLEDFVCDFPGGFSGHFFNKNEERKKIRRQIPRKIRGPKQKTREKSVLPKKPTLIFLMPVRVLCCNTCRLIYWVGPVHYAMQKAEMDAHLSAPKLELQSQIASDLKLLN